MKTLTLSIAAITFLTLTACVTPERVVYIERDRPEPRPAATPYRKAPAATPQDNPETFNAVTKPQSYSGY